MWFRLRRQYLYLRKLTAGGAVALLIFSAGCGDAIQNTGADSRFIRDPGVASTKTKLKPKPGPLFPTGIGSSWRNRVTVRSRDGSTEDLGFEKALISGVSPLAGGGGSGVRLEMRSEKHGTLKRAEILKVDKRGIFLSSVSGEEALAAIPPAPIISYPIREGETKKWTGSIRIDGKTYPGEGYHRVRSPEEITLPQGKAVGYQVDTVLIANIDGRPNFFPMSRWYVPGIGVVRYRYIRNNRETTKELVSYKI